MSIHIASPQTGSVTYEDWFYPDELNTDLTPFGIPQGEIPEIIGHAWELTRCVVPEFKNWDRYLALVRLGVIAYVADYAGTALDVIEDGWVGYSLDEQLDILFGGSSIRDEMAREFRCAVLVMTEKASERRGSALYRRYADALANSAADYLRIRDCDAMVRFYLAAAISCSNSDNWLTEAENQILAEIAVILFDAISFYKHRAEGEICNLFGYVGPQARTAAYRACREVLWALDSNWSQRPDRRCVIHYVRFLGGPVHMLMRRYRYVEDGLTIGNPESDALVDDARHNVKLWYRSDPMTANTTDERYEAVQARKNSLLFEGFAEMLDRPSEAKCQDCRRKEFYGVGESGQFSGIALCEQCKGEWRGYLETVAGRARDVLPIAVAQRS